MRIFVEGTKRSAVSRMFSVWNEMGHEVVSNIADADVQLSTVKIKNKRKPTLLRLDGIYYDKAMNYKAANSAISKSHRIADAVVYQSETCKTFCEHYLKPRETKIFEIIYNGINPDGWFKNVEHDQINIVSCSKWRRPKRLKEIIDIFSNFLKIYPNSRLHIIGPFVRGEKHIRMDRVEYYGKIDHKTMMQIYSEMDIYLHLCKNDACPSTVIEAMAAGISVVTTNACGGATEMCAMAENCFICDGEEVSVAPDFIYRDSWNCIPKEVEKNILKTMQNIVVNKHKTKLPDILHIRNTAEKYIELMKRILK